MGEIHTSLGEEVVTWLRENFEQADSMRSGNLAREQLIDLVKLTYVPRGAHLDKMLKWFEKKDLESMHVTKEAFMNGFYQLAGSAAPNRCAAACCLTRCCLQRIFHLCCPQSRMGTRPLRGLYRAHRRNRCTT